jgi:hypothetical protein
MPKCKDCGNTKEFITAWIEFEVSIFKGDKCVDNYAGDRERVDETYLPECKVCSSTDIEGVELI